MSNLQVQSLTVNGTTYDIVDNTSGYMTGMTILSYGNSTWQDFIDAYTAKKVVYCRASSQSNPGTGSQTRLAFMAYVNDADNPTSVEFQYYRSVSTKTESQQGDQVFIYTLTSSGSWSVITREASVKVAVGGDLNGSYSGGTYTISADIPDQNVISVDQKVTTGVNIADIIINGTATALYAPQGGGSGTITRVKTTAGAHTAIDVSSGSASFNVPTNTSHLTNDSGFITSYTDEKVKRTLSTTSNTYYPLQSDSTEAVSTANTLNGISFYQYYNTAGGYRRLNLGNSTAYKATGGAYGTIRLYGSAPTYYGDLVPGVLGTTSGDGHISANRTWTLPDATGTIALTSNIPTKTSDLTNDSGFITSYTDEKVKQTAITSGGIVYRVLLGSTSDNYTGGANNSSTLTYTENDGLAIGNTSSVYARYAKNEITFTRSSAGYYKIAIPESNGSNKVATFPEKTGTIAFTDDIPTVPTITLNGTSTMSASFYAPTTAGTSGYYLKSNGSGAPSWKSFPTIPTITNTYSATSSNGMSGVAVASALSGYLPLSAESTKSLTGDLYFENNKAIRGMTTGLNENIALNGFQACNENNNCIVGYGGYENQIGKTNIYGNDISLYTNDAITFSTAPTITYNNTSMKLGSVYIKEVRPSDSVSFTSTSSNTKIPVATNVIGANSFLTMEGGNITVEQDCYVMVWGYAYVTGLTAGDSVYMVVWRDGTLVVNQYFRAGGVTDSFVIMPSLISCDAGAKISFAGRNSSGVRGSVQASTFTKFSVQVVGLK